MKTGATDSSIHLTGLTAFTSPYFINPKALNWGVRYCWIWAGSNAITFGKLSRGTDEVYRALLT